MLNQLKTVLLLGLLSALVVGVGWFFGPNGMIIALIFAIVLNFISYFWSDKIVLSLYRAKEADKKQHASIYQMVSRIAHTAGIPHPKVYIIEDPSPNAFATGRNPEHGAIAYTTGILKLLTEEELAGVTAHEMAHIKNRDILVSTIAAVLGAVVAYTANIFAILMGGDEDNWLAALAIAITAPIIAMLIQLAISRTREYLADDTGASFTRKPKDLASALRKITGAVEVQPMHADRATASLFFASPFQAGKVASWFSTHPPVGERCARLEKMRV
jgi:heat shock protein HtpX